MTISTGGGLASRFYIQSMGCALGPRCIMNILTV